MVLRRGWWEWGTWGCGGISACPLVSPPSLPEEPGRTQFARRAQAGLLGGPWEGGPWGLHRAGRSTPGRLPRRGLHVVSPRPGKHSECWAERPLDGKRHPQAPTCKAQISSGPTGPVSFSFQPEPPDPENGGAALGTSTPTPAQRASPSSRPALPARQLCPAQLHPLSQLPPGRRAGQTSPGLVGLHSKGQGPLLGSISLPHAPGTQGQRWAKKRLETQQCRALRSPIPPGITPVPRFLLCSILSLSLPPLLSDSEKQPSVIFFFPPFG